LEGSVKVEVRIQATEEDEKTGNIQCSATTKRKGSKRKRTIGAEDI